MKPVRPDFGYTKPLQWTKDAEKPKKLPTAVYKPYENTNYRCRANKSTKNKYIKFNKTISFSSCCKTNVLLF